ncbi:YfaZ family outer membrane protein [Budvicia diplopodorum]|uniref:YfaZ family outer membrane protein n=1 Tax=Budvicia diplopodorum TaxID=1119056 RepID=UPI001358610B|nr:YfaZ family outer membrane protein [Budvicia diplopodorum]
MKKLLLAGACAAFFLSTAANAISVHGQAGEDYTNVQVGLGTESTGLAVTGNWSRSDHNGEVYGLGLGLNVPVGPLMATVGGKALYLNPENNDDDFAAAVGGGLRWPVTERISLYGEGYYAPDSLTTGSNSYYEATGGVRLDVFRPISVDAGYRYVKVEGEDGNRNSVVADGPYVGASVSF